MSDVLRLTDVALERDGVQILHGVNWTVASADRWVILGPNGAGKTSLITLCAARAHASAGTVEILGERLGEASTQELRIRVGLSSAALADRIPPQEHVRNVVLTAAHGITGRLRESYEPLDEMRADALLAAFGMHAFGERRFETLSEGERKRVQIARALMADPEVLLLDEPGAGLDLGGREELLLALTELAADRRAPALVLVTHHVEEIPAGFTHALLMRDGGVVAAGPIAQTLTSANLTAAYGMPITVRSDNGRWTARAA